MFFIFSAWEYFTVGSRELIFHCAPQSSIITSGELQDVVCNRRVHSAGQNHELPTVHGAVR